MANRSPGGTLTPPSAAPGAGPLAVVLVPRLEGSDLVSVDPGSGRVVARTRLRSLVTDIEADTARGTVVAAQTGGIAADADNAMSVTDPRHGSVHYVTLPKIDPSQVEIVANLAVVLHAVIERSGFVVSSVDLRSGNVVQGHVPDGSGLWASAAGSVWTAVATRAAAPSALLRVDPATLATSAGPAVGFEPSGVTMSGDRVLVTGADAADRTKARVALLDAKKGSVTASAAVPGLVHGAHLSATVGGLLVVGDWNGEPPETGSLAVLDVATLRARPAIDIGGAPCALASWGGALLVVDRVAGELVKVDPATGTVAWRTSLGASDLVCSKVVMLPALSRR
jgi:outer membrane protein assembly factor BamB